MTHSEFDGIVFHALLVSENLRRPRHAAIASSTCYIYASTSQNIKAGKYTIVWSLNCKLNFHSEILRCCSPEGFLVLRPLGNFS